MSHPSSSFPHVKVKNTFLEFDVDEDEEEAALRKRLDSSPARARSAEPVLTATPASPLRVTGSPGSTRGRCASDAPEVQLGVLNCIWNQHPNQVVPPRLDLPPVEEASASSATDGVSVDELRQLQRKLLKANADMPHVTSSSSVSTMLPAMPDIVEVWDAGQGALPHAWSSGSLNTTNTSPSSPPKAEDRNEESRSEEVAPTVSAAPIISIANAIGADLDLPVSRASSSAAPLPSQQQAQALAESKSQSSAPARATDRPARFDPQAFSHHQVPRNVDLAQEFAKSTHEKPTTMMIRNIPNRYTQSQMMKELEDLGFAKTFDFLYVPMDKGTACSVGYAFVNFTDHSYAERCTRVFENYVFKKHRKGREKIASVSVAHIQGLEANLRHYQKNVVNQNGVWCARQRDPIVQTQG